MAVKISIYNTIKTWKGITLYAPTSSLTFKCRSTKTGKCAFNWILKFPIIHPKPKHKWKHDGAEKTKPISGHTEIQNGNTIINKSTTKSRGVGIINGPIGCLPPHPNSPQIKEIPRFAHTTILYQIRVMPFGLAIARNSSP